MPLRRSQMRYWLLAVLVLVAGQNLAAQPDKDKGDTLKENVAQAELVAIGKVTGTIDVGAGSFYYITIELTDVLKGQKDTKTIAVRVRSVPSEEPPAYTKKGTEGV